MAAAYAAVSNNGVYCSPVSIDKVVLRRDSSELPVPKTRCSQAVTPEIALAMVHAMKPVVSGGTGSASNPGDGIPLAGKTGTSDNRIHTWMIGFSSKVATATWVGNVVGQTPQGSKSINGNAVSTIRHVIWKQIMTEVNAKYGGDNWAPADPKFIEAPSVIVPNVAGSDPETAKVQLGNSLLSGAVVATPVQSALPAGTVAYTKPDASQPVPRGTLVKIYISSGGRTLVPDVKGLTVEQAKAKLEAAGFTVSLPQPSQTQLLNKCDPNVPNGATFGTQPEAGKAVLPASAIIVLPNKCG
jgi:membrane peptidoglycan carboxypeptidase